MIMPYPTKKLGEVLEYEQPTKYLVSSTDYKNEYPIPVLTAGKSFILGNTDENKGIFPKEKLPVIIFDDFTTAIKFVDFPFKVKSSAMKILHAKKDKADIRFLFYKMLTIKFAHDQHKRYWISECSNIEIPLPPLEIQKQIVERLDKIAEAQRLNDELIQKTGELFQSLLHKELNPAGKNWEIKKLGDIVETSSGGTPLKEKSEFYENGTIPWLRSGEVSQGLIYKSELFITEKGLKESSAKIFPINTILVAMYGATTGQIGLLKFETSTNQAICGIFPNGKFVPEYLYYFLKTKTKYLIKISAGGAQPNISQTVIRNLKVPLPDVKTQKQIVAKLSAVQDYKKQLLGQKVKLKELFNSALAKSMDSGQVKI
jgi:type I restriction enzyme S subunit